MLVVHSFLIYHQGNASGSIVSNDSHSQSSSAQSYTETEGGWQKRVWKGREGFAYRVVVSFPTNENPSHLADFLHMREVAENQDRLPCHRT